ncbi:MAG TPA: DUF1801 domain-containing protein [Candidatus Nanopelagicaceae bacterium]
MNPRVDTFIKKSPKWRQEFEELRKVSLASGLAEDLKWGQPCYTLNNKNVFLFHGFKEYCAILFFKGALMSDPKGILIRQTENVQSSRQVRFTSVQEIVKLKKTLKSYISEAIDVEEAGLQVVFKKPAELVITKEIQGAMKKIPGLTAAFKKLTPGRQRAYILHFDAAKQEKTRVSRVEKSAPLIFKGKGLNEEY